MIGEKEQIQDIIELSGEPNKKYNPKEKNIFKRFLAFIAPWAVKARNITEDYYSGEADRRKNEAEKFAAETAEIAAKTELAKLEKIKLENELIDQVFVNEDISDQAKLLKIANILANNRNLSEQLQNVEGMMSILKVINFTQIGLTIQPKTETYISETQKKENLLDEEKKHMRELLTTKLIDLDLSIEALNVLKHAEIDTLGDLVSFEKNDLLKFANFGKKTFLEVEELVYVKGLLFGMDLSKYGLDLE